MISAPRSLLLVRPDGMGDLILFEPVLRGLRKAWPQTKITVLVRTQLCELGSLLFPEFGWVGTPIDPFRQGPSVVGSELTRLKQVLAELGPAVVVACAEQRNWLDSAVAAMLPNARAVALASNAEPVYFGSQLRALFPLLPMPAFPEVAPTRPDELAWMRSGGITDYLLGRDIQLQPPRWDLPSRISPPATGLEESPNQAYVVCAAAGFANVPIKTWPADRFVAVLRWLRTERKLAGVLVGSRSEESYLKKIAAESGAGVWISDSPDWLAMAALMKRSQLVLGNDTGLLHLAAALGRPVVGIYGGGTWPRFVPSGPGAVVVNPLPCFGCGWDCAFGNAPCITAVAAEEVQAAIAHVLEGSVQPECAVVETHRFLPETTAVMGTAAARYWELGAELNRREHHFHETVRLAAEKDPEIRALKAATDEKDREIRELKAAADGKDREIEALKLETELRDKRADSIQREAEVRSSELVRLHEACAALQQACDERLAVIERLNSDLKSALHRTQELEKASARPTLQDRNPLDSN